MFFIQSISHGILFLQGCLVLENQYQATLQYSISKDSFNDKAAKAAQDWFCIHVILFYSEILSRYNINIHVYFSAVNIISSVEKYASNANHPEVNLS